MKDTSAQVEQKFRQMLAQRSGEERLKMGCSMHAAARALVIASIPEKDAVTVNRALFLRFYGDEFEPEERKKILLALQKAAKDSKKWVNLRSGAVREKQGTYRAERKNRPKR